jgi:RNA polymerase sigma-70 factor (ECF subfamily)
MNHDSFAAPYGDVRLNEIETHLSKLFASGQSGHDEFLRYYGAAFRYFRALVGDGDAAKDLTNQFAQRFFDGDFDRFDPAKGRFRDFIKTAIRNMAIDHQRRRNRAEPIAEHEPAAPPANDESAFDDAWQEELLHQTWRALERRQQQDGHPYYTVLKLKADQPQTRSVKLAEILSQSLDRRVTPEAARQWVHRARDLFQDLLVNEVAYSIGSMDRERIREELESLRLTSVCRAALERRFGPD